MFKRLIFFSVLAVVALITLSANGFSAEIGDVPNGWLPYIKEGSGQIPDAVLWVDSSLGDVKVPGFVPAPDKDKFLRELASNSTKMLYTGVNRKTKTIAVYGFGVKPDYNANFNKITISSPRGGNDGGGGSDGGGGPGN